MAKIDYALLVHNEYDNQTIAISGQTTGAVVDEANMDAAVQAFASNLVSGNTSYPLTVDYIHKTTTSSDTATL